MSAVTVYVGAVFGSFNQVMTGSKERAVGDVGGISSIQDMRARPE